MRRRTKANQQGPLIQSMTVKEAVCGTSLLARQGAGETAYRRDVEDGRNGKNYANRSSPI